MPYVYDKNGVRSYVDNRQLMDALQSGFTLSPPKASGKLKQVGAKQREAIERFGQFFTPDAMERLRGSISALVHDYAAENPDLYNHRLKTLNFRGHDVNGQPLFTAIFEGDVLEDIDYYDESLPGRNTPSDYTHQQARVVTFGAGRSGQPIFDRFDRGQQTIPEADLTAAAANVIPTYMQPSQRLDRVLTALTNGTIEYYEAIDRARIIIGGSEEEARIALGRAGSFGFSDEELAELDDAEMVALFRAAGGTIDTGPDGLAQEEGPLSDPLWDFINSLVGGGGGGGGPSYTAPDRGLVEDNMKALLVSLVGRSDDARVKQLADLYLRDARRAAQGASIDPAQSVREMVRSYADYKVIHANRPENIDESQWITKQFSGLINEGLRTSAVQDRAITQARVGTSPARAGRAGTLFEYQETGRAVPSLMNRIRRAATAGFRRIA